MNKYQKAFTERPAHYLMHYNHNHDKLGRFARSNGSGGGISNRDKKKIDKDLSNPSIKKANANPFSKSGTIRSITGIKQTKNIKSKTNRKDLRDEWEDAVVETELYNEKRNKFTESMKAYSDRSRELDAEWDKKNPTKYSDKFGEDYDDYRRDKSDYRAKDKRLQRLAREMRKAEDDFFNSQEDALRIYAKEHVDQYIDATIKDLNLENTKEIRDYIEKNYDPDWVSKSHFVKKRR